MFKLFNTSQYFAGSSETLEILKRQKNENKKTKRQKQKKTVPQRRGLYKLQRKSSSNFRIPVLKNSRKSLENIRDCDF